MPITEFLGLKATHNPHRWILPVEQHLCTPGDFLFGGAALAAGIEAMEQTTGRQTIWATAQYLSFARRPATIDIDVEVPVSGNSVSQARAIAHVHDKEIIAVNAALGDRPSDQGGIWAECPDAPAPETCPVVTIPAEHQANIHHNVEKRLVRGKFGFFDFGEPSDDGRLIFWCKFPGMEMSAATLAIIADFMPSGVGNVLQRRAGGNSLDNTIRIIAVEPSEWVLCDVHIHAIARGFGHGRIHLWSQSRKLLATANQSVIVRIHE